MFSRSLTSCLTWKNKVKKKVSSQEVGMLRRLVSPSSSELIEFRCFVGIGSQYGHSLHVRHINHRGSVALCNLFVIEFLSLLTGMIVCELACWCVDGHRCRLVLATNRISLARLQQRHEWDSCVTFTVFSASEGPGVLTRRATGESKSLHGGWQIRNRSRNRKINHRSGFLLNCLTRERNLSRFTVVACLAVTRKRSEARSLIT